MQAPAAPWQVPTCASRRRGGRAGEEGLDDDSSSASRPLQAVPSRSFRGPQRALEGGSAAERRCADLWRPGSPGPQAGGPAEPLLNLAGVRGGPSSAKVT